MGLGPGLNLAGFSPVGAFDTPRRAGSEAVAECPNSLRLLRVYAVIGTSGSRTMRAGMMHACQRHEQWVVDAAARLIDFPMIKKNT
jgi:hypothetical protein